LKSVTDTYTHRGHALKFVTKYDYDGYGQGSTVDYNGAARVVYEKDDLGRLHGVKRKLGSGPWEDLTRDIEYFADGSVMQETRGNNLLTDYYRLYEAGMVSQFAVHDLDTSDANDVPARESAAEVYPIANPHLGTHVWRERYVFPAADPTKYLLDNYYDPLKMRIGPSGTDSWFITAAYDGEQQLVSAAFDFDQAGETDFSYQMMYDELGNRIFVDNYQCSFSYETDPETNRLDMVRTTAGSTVVQWYDYDAMGNIFWNGEHVFTFDLMGRLVAADGGSAFGGVTFYYDSSGKKIMKETADHLWAYYYGAGGEVLCERLYSLPGYSELGAIYFYYANGQAIAQDESGLLSTTGFVGREFDPDLNLYQLGARWYDPSIGRFLSPDPIPSSLNQYAYAVNNPFVYQDANGRTVRLFNLPSGSGPIYAKGYEELFSFLFKNKLFKNQHKYLSNEVSRVSETCGRFEYNSKNSFFYNWNMIHARAECNTGVAGLGALNISIPSKPIEVVIWGVATEFSILRAFESGSLIRYGFHATTPEAAAAIRENGFLLGTVPGRLGTGGVYVADTPEAAIAEFRAHWGVNSELEVIKVRYMPGIEAITEVAPNGLRSSFPFYDIESITAPSTRYPGGRITNILNESAEVVK
jgi:RHS repeat-associated protein